MHLKSRDFEHITIVSRNYKSALKISENVSGKENFNTENNRRSKKLPV